MDHQVTSQVKVGIPPVDIDPESGHQLLASFLDVLQLHFKRDTDYSRPLISPQANTIFALDKSVALDMIAYLNSKLTQSCGFEKEDFRITHRHGNEGLGLQRLRLDFSEGVTFDTMRQISTAMAQLKKAL